MTDIEPTADAADVLARTLWGEARGEGEAGMIAVACVVLNRVRESLEHGGTYWWGRDVAGVCRARAQFSCWNPSDPNRAKLLSVDLSDPQFRIARKVAEDAVADRLSDPMIDPTLGATSYKVASLPWPYSWGHPRTPLVTIGRHAFYNLAVE